ncbi:hypothetical protein [Achromobacter xylosoxidans]|uniref:Uncharacterized protein n=1 Tax=Alcaligenes xylosoxydans xylosoxydans TaxID=85698 RepID=A0A1R1JSI8_ALCXX|nr:hypothetical protein [Achromobacter xylosoxidans]OMG85390.1 hypothetical protein BIZ92_26965 [Achromobacter xylosoxidans]
MGILDGLFDSGNHESIIGAFGAPIQKVTDPMAWLPGGLGDKWVDLTSHKIPEMTNRVGSKVMTPFDRIDETINPVRQIPIVDRVGDVIRDKPGDAVGIALGGYFAAPAIAGAAGAGGAGGAGAGAAGGAGGGLGGGMGALGTGTFNTMGAYATPLMQGLGTGTAGTGMGATGTSAATLGSGAAAASPFSAVDAMQMGQSMLGQQQRQQQQPQQMPMMGGGGGTNMRGLFSQLIPQVTPRQVSRTSGLLDKIIGGL